MNTRPKPERMTADEFLVWAEAQPSGRYELVGGVVVQMPGECVAHVRAKAAAAEALHSATATVGVRCEAMIGGMAVRIDERTMYVPDALVRCGEPLPGEAIEVLDPVIVVEVVWPAALGVDSGAKLAGYFSLPSVRHYLVSNPDAHVLTHHRRDEDGGIATRILHDGSLRLDPPGLDVTIESLFPER